MAENAGLVIISKNMVRYVTISAALWALLTPILCAGGLLAHPCDCGAELECSHENDCAADPCHAPVVTSSASKPAQCLALANITAPHRATATYAVLPVHAAFELNQYDADHALDIKRIPFPQSDLPLLI